MLKTLLQLWWIETRRTFDWKRLGVFLYLLFLLAALVIGFYAGGGDRVMSGMAGLPFQDYAVMMALATIVPDFMMKLMLKQDAAMMDDFLKSKPVAERTWNRFLLVSNLLDYWNWMTPIVMTVLFGLLMPVGYALLGGLTVWFVSIADGLAITCLRKATDWAYKLAVWIGLLFFLFLLTPYAFFMSGVGAVVHMLGMIGFALVALWVLYRYLFSLSSYNESRAQASSVRGMRGGTLLSLEYVSLLRAKRLRQMVLMCAAIFLFQAYTQNYTANEFGVGFTAFYVFFAIDFPTLVLGQWGFGVEANFFHGLMTKPVTVERLLLNKFFFYMLINVAMTLLMIPGVWLGYWSYAMLVAALLLSVGSNLLLLPTCLFSTRLDVFSSAFFNYQGANWSINVYAFVAFIPMVLFISGYGLLSDGVASAVLSAVGVVLICVHRPVIRRIAKAFMRRKYERMEKFSE